MKKFIRWILGVLAVLVIIGMTLFGPVDVAPLQEQSFYRRTMQRLDTLRPQLHLSKGKVKAAWAKVNLTPTSPMPMAGYAPRDHFDAVHDSIYVRILAIDNGGIQCFFISSDLLLFPPALKDILESKNAERGGLENRFLYFMASHAHSSLGGWNNTVIGNLILGHFNKPWLDSLANKIQAAMEAAAAHLQPASVNYFEEDASDFVENRLDPEHGKVDGAIRGLKIIREDGSRGLMVSYSAHPTNISHLSLTLSGDYPSSLVKLAESKDFDFAMFASGTVGSHRVKGIEEQEFALCDTLAARLYSRVKSATDSPVDGSTIATAVVQVDYGPSQLHVFQNYKVRDWVFKALFQKLHGDIRYLKIGNILLLGTPCDFSGEILVRDRLGEIAEKQGEKLLITSFNGDYVGYITYDDHYGHSEQEEVMAMNWVGPFYGSYYSAIVKKILEKSQ